MSHAHRMNATFSSWIALACTMMSQKSLSITVPSLSTSPVALETRRVASLRTSSATMEPLDTSRACWTNSRWVTARPTPSFNSSDCWQYTSISRHICRILVTASWTLIIRSRWLPLFDGYLLRCSSTPSRLRSSSAFQTLKRHSLKLLSSASMCLAWATRRLSIVDITKPCLSLVEQAIGLHLIEPKLLRMR